MTARLLRAVRYAARLIVAAIALPVLLAVALVTGRRKKSRLIWGTDPLINNKYWSEAMKRLGRDSVTLVERAYSINDREDFDLYFADLMPAFARRLGLSQLGAYFACAYILRHGAVLHMSFAGGPLGKTPLARLEPLILRTGAVRTVVIPYGGDVAVYSRIQSATVREGFLRSYPGAARRERAIQRQVDRWTRHADTVLIGFTTDGIGRWDVPAGNMLAIDVDQWQPRVEKATQTGPVRILHSANHLGIKGTEYIEEAVRGLKAEGIAVEYVLAHRVKNSEVRDLMRSADIFVDQIVLPGYGLAAIEAMACGLPVLANLDDGNQADLFRRYSYLGQCPIVSVNHETLYGQLKALVLDRDLRRRLSSCGREYVEKFHSYKAAGFLFSQVHAALLEGGPSDLRDIFHPLKSEFTRAAPVIVPPLVRNRIVTGERVADAAVR